jgi:protease IV
MMVTNNNLLLQEKGAMTLFGIFKNVAIILISLQLGPIVIKSIKDQYTNYLESKTQVGVLSIQGVIYDSVPYTKKLYKLFKDPKLKALLIDMNCLGSAAGTGQIIFSEITSLRKKYTKPVVVLVENICTSGGYLIACSADCIIAPSAAIIGSIGSYFATVQLNRFLEMHKVYDTHLAQTNKKIVDPLAELTEKEIVLIQGLQKNLYKEFTEIVAKSRKLSLTKLEDWADGKIFTGKQALKLGLIDKIGTMEKAIEVIREKALIEGEIEWIEVSVQGGLLDFFTEGNNNVVANTLTNLFSLFGSEFI